MDAPVVVKIFETWKTDRNITCCKQTLPNTIPVFIIIHLICELVGTPMKQGDAYTFIEFMTPI